MTEPDAVDPDDIAYIGDEDDERGPGCLVAAAVVSSAFAALGCLGTLIWILTAMGDDARLNGLWSVGVMSPVIGLSVVAGGFGLGLGLHASSRARLSPIPWLRPVAIVAWAVGLAAVIGLVLQANLLLFGARFR